jgi:cyclic pyranopterin phosphate synthase
VTMVPVARLRPPVRREHAAAARMPSEGPLADAYGRVHTDLRISVTDRCNLRCSYCIPDDDFEFRPRSEMMSFEEIVRVARVARSLGVRSVRLTGGEPLVRRDVVTLVRQLAELGFDDLAMTTNGTRLAEAARGLASAGLRRVNVSCDSLRESRFAAIRRRGNLATVLRAMDVAEEAGLLPLKVNVVLLAGQNDDEVLDFAAFARATGRVVRFIEFMPLDAAGAWSRGRLVPADQVLETISARWPLEPVRHGEGAGVDDPASPAERYRFSDGRGEIGVVSSVTRPFCGTCDRLRLTADGAVRNCLFSDEELSARDVIRSGGSDSSIAALLRRAVWAKQPGHGINDPGFLRPARSMSMIGG